MKALAGGAVRCASFDDVVIEGLEHYPVLEHETALWEEAGELLVDFGATVLRLELRVSVAGRGKLEVGLSRECSNRRRSGTMLGALS